jgi:hypothetical protein
MGHDNDSYYSSYSFSPFSSLLVHLSSYYGYDSRVLNARTSPVDRQTPVRLSQPSPSASASGFRHCCDTTQSDASKATKLLRFVGPCECSASPLACCLVEFVASESVTRTHRLLP